MDQSEAGEASAKITKVRHLKTDSPLVLLLRLGTFLCLIGWTWVHFYWESPYGILLWQESTFTLAGRLGISWDEFVGSGANDGVVQKWMTQAGWLFLACAVLAITARRKAQIQMGGLIAGSLLLILLAYARFLKSQRELPMFVEHGGQILIPVLLVMALSLGVRHRVTVMTAMVALIATFAGHGCYAVGFDPWPVPDNFLNMTSDILRVENETARIILLVAGILDFVVCIGIWVPALRCACALYAGVWGLLTALARPVAGMSSDLNYWGADLFLHEVVLRAPHFLIPLYLFLVWRRPGQIETVIADSDTETVLSEALDSEADNKDQLTD